MRGGGHRNENAAAFDAEAYLASVGIGRRVVQLKRKRTFFSQGDPADAVFYIRKGSAELYARDDSLYAAALIVQRTLCRLAYGGNMHIFVTGGFGQTGPAIVSELIANGHSVTGLARSEKSVSRLAELGAQTLNGSLDDLATLEKVAQASDGVIHMAFGGEFSDPASMTRRDCAAIEAMGEALTGSGKPLVITSGTLVMPAGKVATE